MENKIQELTSKIYNEGVEKGKAEAARIIEEAKVTQATIVGDATKEADRIVADAKRRADELQKNTQAELKLFAAQSLDALKSEVTNLLTDKLATGAVQSATADKEFISNVILSIAQEWVKREHLTIATAQAEALRAYFESHAKGLLDKGVKIEQVNGIATSFAIVPATGGYKVTFGEEEFIAYFKEFLRPQLVEMLF